MLSGESGIIQNVIRHYRQSIGSIGVAHVAYNSSDGREIFIMEGLAPLIWRQLSLRQKVKALFQKNKFSIISDDCPKHLEGTPLEERMKWLQVRRKWRAYDMIREGEQRKRGISWEEKWAENNQ